MGWWMVAALILNCWMLWNKGGQDQSWRWWPWTILSTNLLYVKFFLWSKNLKSIPTWKTADEDDEETEDHDTSGALIPMDPFPPSVGRTSGDIAISRILTTWMILIPTLQVRPLGQERTSRPWHRSLLHCDMELSPWPGLATPLRRKRLRQTHRRLLLSLCQRPVHMAIQAGLTRRNHIPETVKERKLWSPDLMMLPGNRIKHMH